MSKDAEIALQQKRALTHLLSSVCPSLQQRAFHLFAVDCTPEPRVFSPTLKDNTRIRGEDFLKNLALKKNHPDFQSDMSSLLPIELNWSFEESYQFVLDNVIKRLP